ncbi:MAG TPA: hypothetical protein VFT72_12565 [Opitutaceae bacterium]|nr:hypothetical protein [Opitutaceae bacterium]
MKRAFLHALKRRRALITQRWRNLLEQLPTRSALGKPELLAYMIDDTLDELFEPEAYQSEDFQGCIQPATTTHKPPTHCRCGVNPYIAFFLAGEAAIVSVVRELVETRQLSEHGILFAESELLFFLRVLAHRDINGFCEVCRLQHPDGPIEGQCSEATRGGDLRERTRLDPEALNAPR